MSSISKYVKKMKILNDIQVLNHSLRLKQIYINNKTSSRNAWLRECMSREGFLLENQASDEILKKNIIASLDNQEFTLLRVLLTDLCNLKCQYCKVCHNIKNPSLNPTPKEKLYKNIDLLFESHKKHKVIHITGGEPLLFFDRVKDIVSYTRSNYPPRLYNYIIVVNTNGLLIADYSKIAFLKKHGVKVIISLDGDREANRLRVRQDGQPSFCQVMSAIRMLQENGIELGISMVVGKHSIESLQRNINFIVRHIKPSSLGVNFIKNTKFDKKSLLLIQGKVYADEIYTAHQRHREKGVFLELLARKIFPFIEEQYRLYDCGASNGTTINIDAAGNLGTCKSFLCLKTKYSDSDIKKIIDDFRKRSPIENPHCRLCPAQGICGNGCAYEAEIHDRNKIIDKRACSYVIAFYKKFLVDVWKMNEVKARQAIKRTGYYLPSLADKGKIIGQVRKDFNSLRQCIGHEI
jgi:uncharacterized protein